MCKCKIDCDSVIGATNIFFFFKQKTAYEIVSRDWSSDVCSSDLNIFFMKACLTR